MLTFASAFNRYKQTLAKKFAIGIITLPIDKNVKKLKFAIVVGALLLMPL